MCIIPIMAVFTIFMVLLLVDSPGLNKVGQEAINDIIKNHIGTEPKEQS